MRNFHIVGEIHNWKVRTEMFNCLAATAHHVPSNTEKLSSQTFSNESRTLLSTDLHFDQLVYIAFVTGNQLIEIGNLSQCNEFIYRVTSN